MYVYENDIDKWNFRKPKNFVHENVNNWIFPNERKLYVAFARLKPSYWKRYT